MEFRSFFLLPLEQRSRFVLLAKVRKIGLFVTFRLLFMTKEFLALEYCYNASAMSREYPSSGPTTALDKLGWLLVVFKQI